MGQRVPGFVGGQGVGSRPPSKDMAADTLSPVVEASETRLISVSNETTILVLNGLLLRELSLSGAEFVGFLERSAIWLLWVCPFFCVNDQGFLVLGLGMECRGRG